MKRLFAMAATTGIVAVLPVLTAVAPANADQSCTGVLTVPVRWSVRPATDDGSNFTYAVKETGTCSDSQSYYYFVWNGDGDNARLEAEMDSCGSPLEGPGGSYWEKPPLGVITWKGTGKSECDASAIATNSPTTEFRLGSRGSMSASRSGGKVTLSVRAKKYWTSTKDWGNWNAATGLIEYRTPGTSDWHPLKNVKTSRGKYTYSYHTSHRRFYRVLMPNANNVWGFLSTSTPKR